MDGILQDIRYGLRRLARAPGFAGTAALTLALGIGANAALFSLLDAALFKRLPVPDPEQLVSVVVTTRTGGWMANVPSVLFEELRREPRSFSGLFAFWQESATIRVDGEAERALVQQVSGDYHATLGVGARLGRLIERADDTTGGADVAVLGYDFWTRRFAADPAVLGKTVFIGKTARTIVGVTPPGFFGTDRAVSPDITIPLGDPRTLANVWVMGRLRADATLEQARAETERAWLHSIEILRPGLERYRKSDREQILTQGVDLRAGDREGGRLGMRAYAGQLRVLIVLSSVVLLIGCANIASLLLARASARSAEIATRLVLGVGRMRLIRQMLVESALLAAIGGVLGLAFGFLAHGVLVLFVIGDTVPAGVEFTLDYRLLLFTMGVSLGTALLFGLVPALRAGRTDLVQALKRDARLPRLRAGRGLVVAQVAACVVLLAAGTLLARTLANLRTLDRGFSADSLLLVNVGVGDHARTGAHVAAFYQDLISRAEGVSGVVSASLGANALFGAGGWRKSVWVQGRPAEERQSAAFNVVAPGFFATTGMRVLSGRDLSTRDRPDTPRVVIVNEAFARAYCPAGAPLGCRFGDNGPQSSGKYDVVGMVKNARYGSLREPPEPMIYEALMQEERPSSVTLHVRAKGSPALLESRLRHELRQVDATLPVHSVRTIAQQIDRSLRQDRMMATLSGYFALLALFLTSLGLFGTVAYGVERRMREIGIRIALGGGRGHVLRVVLGDSLFLVGLGAAAGVLLAIASTRILESMLFGISPTSVSTVAGVVFLLFGTSALACYLPARRAAGLDPMTVLRRE